MLRFLLLELRSSLAWPLGHEPLVRQSRNQQFISARPTPGCHRLAVQRIIHIVRINLMVLFSLVVEYHRQSCPSGCCVFSVAVWCLRDTPREDWCFAWCLQIHRLCAISAVNIIVSGLSEQNFDLSILILGCSSLNRWCASCSVIIRYLFCCFSLRPPFFTIT